MLTQSEVINVKTINFRLKEQHLVFSYSIRSQRKTIQFLIGGQDADLVGLVHPFPLLQKIWFEICIFLKIPFVSGPLHVHTQTKV